MNSLLNVSSKELKNIKKPLTISGKTNLSLKNLSLLSKPPANEEINKRDILIVGAAANNKIPI